MGPFSTEICILHLFSVNQSKENTFSGHPLKLIVLLKLKTETLLDNNKWFLVLLPQMVGLKQIL